MEGRENTEVMTPAILVRALVEIRDRLHSDRLMLEDGDDIDEVSAEKESLTYAGHFESFHAMPEMFIFSKYATSYWARAHDSTLSLRKVYDQWEKGLRQ